MSAETTKLKDSAKVGVAAAEALLRLKCAAVLKACWGALLGWVGEGKVAALGWAGKGVVDVAEAVENGIHRGRSGGRSRRAVAGGRKLWTALSYRQTTLRQDGEQQHEVQKPKL
ncbi:MAG: hypothetical protein ACKERG_04500 [Candidatus Hodgkinia cicadicola]